MLYQENVKVVIIGDITPFPKFIKNYIINLEELTKNNDGMSLNLAMNYGGRSEILRATKGIVKAVSDGTINIENLDEDLFAQYLYTNDQKDPDLIIRTAGEKRLSNFLLWQSAYSELFFFGGQLGTKLTHLEPSWCQLGSTWTPICSSKPT